MLWSSYEPTVLIQFWTGGNPGFWTQDTVITKEIGFDLDRALRYHRSMSLQLFSYFRSSCSYRVRIGLNLKGLDYETTPVHLVKNGGEQFSSEFKAHNPSGKVPVLVHNGISIAQSVAIFEYLEECFPESPLYPKEAIDKAQIRQMVELVNSDIQPLQNLRVLKHLIKSYGLETTQKEDWIRHWIHDGFVALEALVEKSSSDGRFCFEETPSVLDCFLIPQVYNAERFGMDMKAYPTLNTINTHCLKMEAFQKAHPSCQPDSPQDENP